MWELGKETSQDLKPNRAKRGKLQEDRHRGASRYNPHCTVDTGLLSLKISLVTFVTKWIVSRTILYSVHYSVNTLSAFVGFIFLQTQASMGVWKLAVEKNVSLIAILPPPSRLALLGTND